MILNVKLAHLILARPNVAIFIADFFSALKSSEFLFPEKALQSDKYKWFVSLPIRLNLQFCPLCTDNEGTVLAHGSLPPRKERTQRAQLQCPVCGWMQCSPDQWLSGTLGHLAMPDINAYHNIHSVLLWFFFQARHMKSQIGVKRNWENGERGRREGIIKRKNAEILPVSYVLPFSRGCMIQEPSWGIVSKSCCYCVRPPEKFLDAVFKCN